MHEIKSVSFHQIQSGRKAKQSGIDNDFNSLLLDWELAGIVARRRFISAQSPNFHQITHRNQNNRCASARSTAVHACQLRPIVARKDYQKSLEELEIENSRKPPTTMQSNLRGRHLSSRGLVFTDKKIHPGNHLSQDQLNTPDKRLHAIRELEIRQRMFPLGHEWFRNSSIPIDTGKGPYNDIKQPLDSLEQDLQRGLLSDREVKELQERICLEYQEKELQKQINAVRQRLRMLSCTTDTAPLQSRVDNIRDSDLHYLSLRYPAQRVMQQSKEQTAELDPGCSNEEQDLWHNQETNKQKLRQLRASCPQHIRLGAQNSRMSGSSSYDGKREGVHHDHWSQRRIADARILVTTSNSLLPDPSRSLTNKLLRIPQKDMRMQEIPYPEQTRSSTSSRTSVWNTMEVDGDFTSHSDDDEESNAIRKSPRPTSMDERHCRHKIYSKNSPSVSNGKGNYRRSSRQSDSQSEDKQLKVEKLLKEKHESVAGTVNSPQDRYEEDSEDQIDDRDLTKTKYVINEEEVISASKPRRSKNNGERKGPYELTTIVPLSTKILRDHSDQDESSQQEHRNKTERYREKSVQPEQFARPNGENKTNPKYEPYPESLENENSITTASNEEEDTHIDLPANYEDKPAEKDRAFAAQRSSRRIFASDSTPVNKTSPDEGNIPIHTKKGARNITFETNHPECAEPSKSDKKSKTNRVNARWRSASAQEKFKCDDKDKYYESAYRQNKFIMDSTTLHSGRAHNVGREETRDCYSDDEQLLRRQVYSKAQLLDKDFLSSLGSKEIQSEFSLFFPPKHSNTPSKKNTMPFVPGVKNKKLQIKTIQRVPEVKGAAIQRRPEDILTPEDLEVCNRLALYKKNKRRARQKETIKPPVTVNGESLEVVLPTDASGIQGRPEDTLTPENLEACNRLALYKKNKRRARQKETIKKPPVTVNGESLEVVLPTDASGIQRRPEDTLTPEDLEACKRLVLYKKNKRRARQKETIKPPVTVNGESFEVVLPTDASTDSVNDEAVMLINEKEPNVEQPNPQTANRQSLVVLQTDASTDSVNDVEVEDPKPTANRQSLAVLPTDPSNDSVNDEDVIPIDEKEANVGQPKPQTANRESLVVLPTDTSTDSVNDEDVIPIDEKETNVGQPKTQTANRESLVVLPADTSTDSVNDEAVVPISEKAVIVEQPKSQTDPQTKHVLEDAEVEVNDPKPTANRNSLVVFPTDASTDLVKDKDVMFVKEKKANVAQSNLQIDAQTKQAMKEVEVEGAKPENNDQVVMLLVRRPTQPLNPKQSQSRSRPTVVEPPMQTRRDTNKEVPACYTIGIPCPPACNRVPCYFPRASVYNCARLRKCRILTDCDLFPRQMPSCKRRGPK